MKRLTVFNILLCIMLALGGCKGGEPAETASTAAGKAESSMGILPTRIENIDKGGTIPAGCEGKAIEEADYRLEMLWGTWVPEGLGDTGKIPDTDKTITLGEGEDTIEIECWPKELCFQPSGGEVYGRTVSIEQLEFPGFESNLIDKYTKSTNIEYDLLGLALESKGYGFGTIDFETVDKVDQLKPEDYKSFQEYLNAGILAGGWDYRKRMAYAIEGNILAVGIADWPSSGFDVFDTYKSDENMTETYIGEIDYTMSWTGSRLTLTYDGESVVYVPKSIEKNYGIEIKKAGPFTDSDVVDGILGMTVVQDSRLSYKEDAVMFDLHEGYIEADYHFTDDGTLILDSSAGDSHEYTYLYSGDSLTLISDGQPYVYSSFSWNKGSPRQRATYELYADGNDFYFTVGYKLGWLVEMGFTTDYDLTQPMASCQVTDKIYLDYNGTKIEVKVVNPYENPILLGDCCVCYIYVDDVSGVIVKGDGTGINKTTYDEIEFFYDVPYEKTDNMLRYKAEEVVFSNGRAFNSYDQGMSGTFYSDVYSQKYNGMFNRILLTPDVYKGGVEVIFGFQDGILKYYRIEMLPLLYNGLQDNVDASILANMAPSKFSGIIEVRDTILDRLKSAFQSAGVSVGIDDSTGEIVLDSNILFGVDKTDLSDEGKQYIDSFMGVYASVVTDSEFADYIDKVLFEGHTDSSGSYNYNMELSQARADAVLEYCLSSGGNGMDPEQREVLKQLSSTIGYSCSDLIYGEDGKEDMDASRRVAIKFYVKVE